MGESGAAIVAVEPDHALAEALRAQTRTAQGWTRSSSAFEDVELGAVIFDLVAAGVLRSTGSTRSARSRRSPPPAAGGWLALWWNVFGDPDRPDPFHDATEPLLRDLARGPCGTGRREVEARGRRSERGAADYGFHYIQYEAVRWTLHLDASQTRHLYSTFSNIARLPSDDQAALLDELQRIATVDFGDRVEREMVTPMYTAHRPSR